MLIDYCYKTLFCNIKLQKIFPVASLVCSLRIEIVAFELVKVYDTQC